MSDRRAPPIRGARTRAPVRRPSAPSVRRGVAGKRPARGRATRATRRPFWRNSCQLNQAWNAIAASSATPAPIAARPETPPKASANRRRRHRSQPPRRSRRGRRCGPACGGRRARGTWPKQLHSGCSPRRSALTTPRLKRARRAKAASAPAVAVAAGTSSAATESSASGRAIAALRAGGRDAESAERLRSPVAVGELRDRGEREHQREPDAGDQQCRSHHPVPLTIPRRSTYRWPRGVNTRRGASGSAAGECS